MSIIFCVDLYQFLVYHLFTFHNLPMKSGDNNLLMHYIFSIISAFTFFFNTQQTLTTIAGKNAYVHLPTSYIDSTSKFYPVIIYFPTLDEVGTDHSKLLLIGPSKFIADGSWNGNTIVNGNTHENIVISIQPSAGFSQPYEVDSYIDSVVKRWRVDRRRIYTTGASNGGFMVSNYLTDTTSYGKTKYPYKIAATVPMSAVVPNHPFTNFSRFAIGGGKMWAFQGIYDNRDLDKIVDTMNVHYTLSGRLTTYGTSSGNGGHCCWNTYYSPAYKEFISGDSLNIYQWMNGFTRTVANTPPSLNIGPNKIINQNSTNLNVVASDAEDQIKSYRWRQISGPSTSVINTAFSPESAVTSLITGVYKFEISVADALDATTKDTLQVTVNLESVSTTYSFNLSAEPYAVPGWTNLSGDPSLGVRTATNAGINISSVSTNNWVQYAGASAYNGGGVTNGSFFPIAVMLNNWFNAGDFNASLPQFEVSGLNPNDIYTIKMTGSDIYPSDTDPTIYQITGTTSYGPFEINSNNNYSSGITFENVSPDQTGKIRIYVNRDYWNSQHAPICGIQIESSGAAPNNPPVIELLAPQNNNNFTAGSTVSLVANATDQDGLIAKVEFFRGSVLIGEKTSSPFNISWNNVPAGTYQITAKATDNQGASTTTQPVTITVSAGVSANAWSYNGNTPSTIQSFGVMNAVDLPFVTNGIERMRITSSGNIAIGTNNPKGYKLAVNGSAIFEKIRVQIFNAWPDYVFDKKYQLMPIDALAAFVDKHKHLPGVPSSDDVNKNGLDVANMHGTTLKKVEELTLYIIELNKLLIQQGASIDTQNNEIKRLKEKIATLEWD